MNKILKATFMRHPLKLVILLGFLAFAKTLCACDPLSDFHWERATSKQAILACYDLHEELRADTVHTKFITLKELGPRAVFYDECMQAQKIPKKDTIYFDLNPMSGIYLFSAGQNASPLGFIRIGALLDCGIIIEQIAFKKECPKGMGSKSLQILKDQIDTYRGQTLTFCVETEDDSDEYAFGEHPFHYVMAGIDYDNTASLIPHIRMGMEPLLPQGEGDRIGACFTYPPFDHEKFEKDNAEMYAAHIKPQKEKMIELNAILKQVVSQDKETRDIGLKRLQEFKNS